MNPMKMTLWLAIALLPFTAHAGREGNGGDPIAFEFVQSAREGIQDIQGNAGEYPAIKAAELSATLSSAKVIIVNDALFATSGKIKQESAALNFPDTGTIYLNRKSWITITDGEIRKALALHELLGLAGKESTGSYPISQKYLQRRGVDCQKDLCLKPPREQNLDYSQMASLFKSGRMPTAEELNKTYKLVGVAYEPFYAKMPDGPESWYDTSGKEGRLELHAETDFAGTATVITANFYVKSGDNDLNKIVTQSKEANAACFSAPAGYYENNDPFYGEAGRIYNQSYYAYSCRILSGNAEKMLCAKVLKIHPSEVGNTWPKNLDRHTLGYMAFMLTK